jgi:hypothetical protein
VIAPKGLRCADSTCRRERKWIVERPGTSERWPVCSHHLPRWVGQIIGTQREHGARSPLALVRDLDEDD